ncbi:hypothetical protein NDU88_001018 [Pleurodeles waltl]|uniref:Negative elongation factor E n=1 Tax=Pleurodeles waltl TaxID=8319 RepID=A0AAV7Q5T8_PLEWA|nr:hypothetical protein NDU88_001018 [Pleurodeles waltl]
MVIFPTGFTEEEEALQKKYAKLKKKKKALLALKKQSSNNQASQGGVKRSLSDQPVVDTAMVTEQAKMLVKSGAISAIKAENKNSGFKRSRTLEGKLKPRTPSRPWQAFTGLWDPGTPLGCSSHKGGEARLTDPDTVRRLCVRPSARLAAHVRDTSLSGAQSRCPSLFFICRSQGRPSAVRDLGTTQGSDSFPDRRAPRKGNTVYVHGAGMTKTTLRGAFANYGNIIDLATDSVRNCAFVTFEKMESADQAIAELNGTKVEDVLMKVSIAHKQPMLEAATGNSVWGSLCEYVQVV